jgi:broad specificity phosphatase PhoE
VNELWLVRHGTTEWTVNKKHTGTTDIPLTADGERRARELEPVLATHSFAAVFTSPRMRARRTAALAGFEDAVVDDQLTEVDYGEYEGRTTAEIREERPDWFLWRDGSPGGVRTRCWKGSRRWMATCCSSATATSHECWERACWAYPRPRAACSSSGRHRSP